MLELLPAGLVGNQNRSPIQFLKEQSLLQKNQVQGFCRGYLAQVDIYGAWLREGLPIEHDIEVQLVGQLSNPGFQIAAERDRAHLFNSGSRSRLLRLHGRGRRRSPTAVCQLCPLSAISRRRRRNISFLDFLQPQHPLHFGNGELVHRVITEGLPKSVISPDIVTLFSQRSTLLHERLRGIENRAAIMQLIIRVRWIRGEGQGELLGRLFPLLGLFQLHAAIKVFLSFLANRDDRGRQHAGHDDQGNNRVPTDS